MPLCKQCGKRFSQYIRINGGVRRNSRRTTCLRCLPYASQESQREIENGRLCMTCGGPLTGSQTRYCNTCIIESNSNHFEKQRQRALERKKALIALLGGACQRCGYRRNAAALTFHHTGRKAFALDSRHLANTAWEALVKEAAQCELLCANCHHELHYEATWGDRTVRRNAHPSNGRH